MLGTKIGFDIGSSTVFALVEGKGVLIGEPSVIAYDTFSGKIKSIGKEAAKMIGKTPDSVTVVRPVSNGVISDYDSLQNMLSYYIQRLCGNRILKPNIMICVPADISDLDRRSILDVAEKAGASRACVVEEPVAAALGAGLDPEEFRGRMVVDIGGSTTDMAVITRGCAAVSKSINIAGNTFDEGICRFLRRERDIILGTASAEQIKIKVGAAKILDAELAVRAVGKDYFTKLPKQTEITSTDVFLCIKEHIDKIIENIMSLLQQTPPELAADVSANGIVLTGGGALLRNIDTYISEKTGMPTVCASDPAKCVIKGIGVLLKDMKLLEENGYVFKTYSELNEYED